MASKEELQLKNKILNQNRRAAVHREVVNTPIGKRFRPQDNDSDSDNEEESRSTTVGTKQAKNKKKKVAVVPQPLTSGKKKIGNQGDFLSMYLSERAGKKNKKN